ECDREGRALALAADGGNPPAAKLDAPAREGEAQACALEAPAMAGLLLREGLEQPRQVVVVDADAGVADFELQRAAAVAIETEDDLAAVGELDRVLKQV